MPYFQNESHPAFLPVINHLTLVTIRAQTALPSVPQSCCPPVQCSHTEERNSLNLWDNYPKQGWGKKQLILKVMCFTTECRIKDAASVRKCKTSVSPETTVGDAMGWREREGGMYHTFLVGIGQKNASHHRGKVVKCFISELCRCLQCAKIKKGWAVSSGSKEWAWPYRQGQREVRKGLSSSEENPIPRVCWAATHFQGQLEFLLLYKELLPWAQGRLTDWQPLGMEDM